MDQINDPEVFESPILKRGKMLFRGKVLWPAQIRRLVEYRPHLREMAKDGLCPTHAARKLGFNINTVRTWAKILGIHFKKQRNRRVYRYDKTGWEAAIHAGAKAGMTLEALAIQLDTPFVNVARYCYDNGINWKELKKSHVKNR